MKSVFVGNLSFRVTEGELRSLFEGFGTVERVNVVTDINTGKSRGFAFVEMADEEAAAQAISGLNGREIEGRALNVSEAKPKGEGGGGKRKGAWRGSPGKSRGPRW